MRDNRIISLAIKRDRIADVLQPVLAMLGEMPGADSTHLLAPVEDIETFHTRADHFHHEPTAGGVVGAQDIRSVAA